MALAEISKAIGEVGALLNKLFGGYQGRVKDSLITTADDLVFTLGNKKLSDTKRKRLTNHYIRQYNANRLKLK